MDAPRGPEVGKLRSLLVWLLELICEALAIVAWFVIASSLLRHENVLAGSVRGPIATVLGFGVIALALFAQTGFLFTTLIAALWQRRFHWLTYPSVACALYLIHCEIFFVFIKGPPMLPLGKDRILFEFVPAWIVFAVSCAGQFLRRPARRTA